MVKSARPYFDEETLRIIEKMPKGELSKVCQIAVKEWNSSVDNKETLIKRKGILEEEINEKQSRLEFIDKKLSNIEKAEKDEKEYSNKENKRMKVQLEETKTFLKGLIESQEYNLSEAHINDIINEWIKLPKTQQEEHKNILLFIEAKGYNRGKI